MGEKISSIVFKKLRGVDEEDLMFEERYKINSMLTSNDGNCSCISSRTNTHNKLLKNVPVSFVFE